MNMDSFSSSPLNRNFTPIKRLGLGRKRKSLSTTESDQKRSKDDIITSSPVSTLGLRSAHSLSAKKILNSNDNEKVPSTSKKENELVTQLTEDGESSKFLELENVVEVWKTGLKDAILYLGDLFKERDVKDQNLQSALKTLGVWSIITETFADDSDLDLDNM